MKQCDGSCLSVLGNDLRMSIFKLLSKNPQTVQEMCATLGKEQSAVSHALIQLKKCHFVESKVKGKEREYFLKAEAFTKKKNIFEMIEEHEKKCKAGGRK